MRAAPVQPVDKITAPPPVSTLGRPAAMAILLGVSGACALVYQMAWLREFRLIFGGATPAAAAVLAVFMGGLGVGGAWFGGKAERAGNPLMLYARLELGIAASAALTPFALDLVRALYVRTGGVLSLGAGGAVLAQLALAVLVLGVPCVLMGGNLPPAVRWISTDADAHRGGLGLVYGFNALGAVVGVLGATFWALETVGTRGTLHLAAVINAALGAVAWFASRGAAGTTPESAAESVNGDGGARDGVVGAARLSARLVYLLAGVTGFQFFLAELVWYRMLTPLLGGTVYGFGLILAEALLGIGIGGCIYRAWRGGGRGGRSSEGLAVLIMGQATAFALPWAWGDGFAVMSYHVQQGRAFGFGGLVAGWAATVAVMVLVPSILAGIQFPWLVSMLGEGRREIGRQAGRAYAANTVGAIVGSLVGGFVLVPWLTAPGCWQWIVALTVMVGFLVLMASERPWGAGTMAMVLAGGGLALGLGFRTTGPTAGWRQTSMGYGVVRNLPERPAELEDALRRHRRSVRREYEGRESNIAVVAGDEGWGLFVNGKADGSALNDLGTQVMLGMVGAVLHPEPKSAFVIGLGTGATAGWLADVPGMERVDVAELEPRIVDVAREFFGPTNRRALERTNVTVIEGDAREILLAGRRRYDLIVSEPSNPYRAGIASLFTREYYAAVRSRLADGGIFSQWLQGYQLTVETLQLVYATLTAEFPHVETWLTQANDLLFVCHQRPPDYPLARLRERLGRAPFAEALNRAWLENSAEGFLARHFAGPELARRIAARAPAVNHDDRNLLEYGLARALLAGSTFQYRELLGFAVAQGDDQPAHLRAELDAARLAEARMYFLGANGESFEDPRDATPEQIGRVRAIRAWGRGEFEAVGAEWRGAATSPAQRLMLAISAGRAGDRERGPERIRAVSEDWPADAAVASAWLELKTGDPGVAAARAGEVFEHLERHPWIRTISSKSVVELTASIHAARAGEAERLLAAWARPTSVGQLAVSAPGVWYRLAFGMTSARQVEILRAIGTHHPWTREYLGFRWRALAKAGHADAARAAADFARFERQEGKVMAEILAESEGTP